jgi:hypothetical protein
MTAPPDGQIVTESSSTRPLSLATVRDLDVDEVLPAHEWRFLGLAERVDAIAAHHEHRLAELLAAITQEPGSTPWHLASQLTWSRSWDQYGGRMRISAVTETAAHVYQLVQRGLVTASGASVPAYWPAGASGSQGNLGVDPGKSLL